MDLNNAYKYCPRCGGKLFEKQLKKGEPPRLVCSACEFVYFLDPKVAACVITEIDRQIVLLKRGIPPQKGKWVIPGGFVDLGETVPAAAIRETWEEVRLKVKPNALVGVYSYPGKPVVVIVYAARVIGGTLQAADEALEVNLFTPEDIPWEQLAFSSTRDALHDYFETHYPEAYSQLTADGQTEGHRAGEKQ